MKVMKEVVVLVGGPARWEIWLPVHFLFPFRSRPMLFEEIWSREGSRQRTWKISRREVGDVSGSKRMKRVELSLKSVSIVTVLGD